MQLVHISLNFAGNTEEAFTFYEKVFCARIVMRQTFGETAFMKGAPDSAKNKIMHIPLPVTEAVHLMGSDAVEGFSPPLKPGHNFHVSVVANDKAEADRVFRALSGDGGTVTMPIANAPWGPYRDVRRPLRHAVDGEPREARLRGSLASVRAGAVERRSCTVGRRRSPMNPKVDAFLKRQDKWSAELEKLREILLDSGLTEELKWGQPCYALDGKNIALIHGFKEYCAILFHKGALLQDPKGVLVQQTKNVQAARQIRFTSVQEVTRLAKTVKAYVREAIEIECAGLKVQFKKTEDLELPEELESKLAANAKLQTAFAALTPGRQRAYVFHFSQPKLSTTRAARVEKHIPRILAGLGLDD